VAMTRWTRGLGVVLAGVMTVSVASVAAASADEVRDRQWMIEALNLTEAWKTNKGAGVTVGIVDTGVDASHPDLVGNLLPGMSTYVEGGNGLTDADPDGHGTASASLIAGHGHGPDGGDGVVGVAPEAKVLSAQVSLESDDVRASKTDEAIRWLADNGADIILLEYAYVTTYQADHEAIKYAAIERGIPVVGAAGNLGADYFGQNLEIPRSEVTKPAVYPEVIAVSASTESDDLADWSHYGPEVFVSAPGEDITVASPGGGYRTYSGTSASSAITAGVLALLKAQFPDESRMELWWRLGELASDAGDAGPDDHFGFGIVDPVAALTGDPGPLPDHLADPKPTGTYPADEALAADSDDSGVLAASEPANAVPLWLWLAIAAAAVLTITLVGMLIARRRPARAVAYRSKNLVAHPPT